jgi:hypothetical protein
LLWFRHRRTLSCQVKRPRFPKIRFIPSSWNLRS